MSNKTIAICLLHKDKVNLDDKNKVGGKKTDNRVSKKIKIEDLIKNITYTRLPSGKTTVCEIVLKNGFCVTGVTSCVDIDNYDETLAKELSLKDAKNKLFEFAAYDLCTELSKNPSAPYKVVDETSSDDIKKSQNETLASAIGGVVSDFVKKCINNTFFISVEKGERKDSPEMRSIVLSYERELAEDVIQYLAYCITNKQIICDKSVNDFIMNYVNANAQFDLFNESINENTRKFVNYYKNNLNVNDKQQLLLLLGNVENRGNYINKSFIMNGYIKHSSWKKYYE